uniref:Pigment dispersing factor n=1 Tax=Grapholita molesta TaxID=192188 RepID=A0A7D7PJT1_GRAMO|nr:pigment dispersing factor [Grapholita molesta]
MASLRWHPTTLLVTLVLVCGVAERDLRQTYRAPSVQPEITDEEYIRHIHSMINAYRGDVGGRLIIETNALIDTKYRTWKRNADMINSLLALPKGLNDAGR